MIDVTVTQAMHYTLRGEVMTQESVSAA